MPYETIRNTDPESPVYPINYDSTLSKLIVVLQATIRLEHQMFP